MRNCTISNQHYLREIELLKPDFIILMGSKIEWIERIINRTNNNYLKKICTANRFWVFPSPDSRGIGNWKGEKIFPEQDITSTQEIESLDHKLFKAGHEGRSTDKLLQYILNLSNKIKEEIQYS